MMSKINVQLLCEDLDQLLKDICDYLSDQTNNENLTEKERLFANKLIQRSKKQLQEISKVSMVLSTDVDNQSYVVMSKQSEVEESTYEEEDNEYTPIGCTEVPITEEEDICPFESLPAIELEKCEKFGQLDRKGRFLFIGHQKKLFAGVKENWLLLYSTKKDNKPLENLNLCLYTVKPTDSVKAKSFELICTRTQKTFQFVAQTPKDMIQWVACINKRASVREENQSVNPIDKDDDEENVYEQLKIGEDPTDTLKKKISKPLPPLPKTSENTYIVHHPKPELISPDMESYDPVCPPKDPMTEQNDEDDEEQIYDVIQEVKAERRENPVEPKKTEAISNPIRRPSLIDTKTDSILTNSFSDDDDEERIYDVLEQTTSNKPLPKPLKKSFIPEPEEEYCNLVLNENSVRKSPSLRPFITERSAEPEEEYSNLVPNVNTLGKIFSSLKRIEANSNNIKEIQKNEEEEQEEVEYHRVLSPSNILTKQNVQPNINIPKKVRPALKPKPRSWKKN